MKILLANPRGFCAGVDRAIDIVERAITLFGAPIYVRHEVVHNRHVVERLRTMGAVFVEELRDVPDGATVIFSAHGVSKAVEDEAKSRGLTVFDATCPLVTKVHMEVRRYAKEAREVILIGHDGHPEVEGTLGRFDTSFGGKIHLVESVEDAATLEVGNSANLAFVTQTTLSVDDTAEIVETLRRRFPELASPRKEDICYATQNRQDAVKDLLRESDVLVVVLQFQSARRTWASRRDPGLSRRWCGGSAPRVVCRQAVRRAFGGRVRSGGARSRGHRSAAGVGCGGASRALGPRGERGFRVTAGIACARPARARRRLGEALT
jgi:4-hydroxy-3-methylbut-2-enyl diphosphate reductase